MLFYEKDVFSMELRPPLFCLYSLKNFRLFLLQKMKKLPYAFDHGLKNLEKNGGEDRWKTYIQRLERQKQATK